MALCWALGGGCATTLHGMVQDHPLLLKTDEGKRFKLILDEESRPVKYLGGHLVELRGTAAFGVLRVAHWHVGSGLHGMPTFVGVLQRMGVQLGLQDMNSGSFVFVSRDDEATIEGAVGLPVLLEGYVVGPQRISVVSWRPLADTETSP
jgi:hypothetical protein